MQEKTYIFTSERLGFRSYSENDILEFAAINGDAEVMRYFESPMSDAQTADFVARMIKENQENGHCYFAVDILETGQFIGCIGLGKKDFESSFTPCVDIGWRLGKEFWGKGYATEGASRCLAYGFQVLELKEIYAITPKINTPSVHVMEKIGMKFHTEFVHPQLDPKGELNPCLCYLAKND